MTHFVLIGTYVVYGIALKFLQNSYDETQRRKKTWLFTNKKRTSVFLCNVAIGIALYAIMSYSAPNQIWEACVRTDLRFWRVKDTKDSLDNLRQCAHATSLHPLIQSFDVSELTDYIVKISALRTIRTVSVPSCLVAPEAGPRDQTLCENCLHHQALELCNNETFWIANNKTAPTLPFVDFDVTEAQECCSMYAIDSQIPFGPIHCEETTQITATVTTGVQILLLGIYIDYVLFEFFSKT